MDVDGGIIVDVEATTALRTDEVNATKTMVDRVEGRLEISKAIDAAKCVVVVWSRNSVESEWVINEANEGLERDILVPLMIDDVRD